jgi:hypothetical protein
MLDKLQVGSQISTIDTVLYSTNVAFSLTLPPQKHTKPDQPTPTQCETHLVRRTQAQTQTQKREAIHDAHTRTGHSARQRNGTERRGYNRVNWCQTWTILRSGRNRTSTGRNNKLDVVRNYLLATTTVSFVLGMLTCRSATKPAIDLHGVDKQKRTSAIASSAAGKRPSMPRLRNDSAWLVSPKLKYWCGLQLGFLFIADWNS